MNLKLKDEYKGLTITKSLFGIGQITLNTQTVLEEDYQNFFNIGFDECFYQTVPKYKAPIQYHGITDISESKKPIIKANIEIVKTKTKKKNEK